MWNTNTLWFEVAVVSIFILLGHLFLGHFEERSPKWRKLLKYLATVLIVVLISIFFGRAVSMTILGLTLIPIGYVHGILLPRKGINGWTGEPKSRYYEFRGWDKDIFGSGENNKLP
jgi:Kef-type K+ transport system membrane component KefB